MKKDREYTELQSRFLQALADPDNKGNIRECMRIAGYNDGTRLKDVLDSLHEEMIEIANRLLASGAVKASVEMINVLDEPNALGTQNKLKAAKEILDRAGVYKDKDNSNKVTVNSTGGIIILPAKGSMEQTEDNGDEE